MPFLTANPVSVVRSRPAVTFKSNESSYRGVVVVIDLSANSNLI